MNNLNNTLIGRAYQYNPAGNIIERATEQGKVNYRYDLLDRLTEATPEKTLQGLGLPDEAYTYDAIGNCLGSRHQPGQFEYNQQDQLVKWGANAQLEALTYTATGQVKQKKKITETTDYHYDATDRLTQVKRNDTEVASYQYDPFGRRLSKRVKGELTYYLYSDEGLIAELNEQGKVDVAYGWEPNAMWGTSPLWQANLKTGQTLQNADYYHYLHTDHIGTPQIATNQEGNITWQAVAEAFGETQLNPDNQITMNLRFPGQYFDAETGTHYNYFRDYNPQTGRYQQSDPIGLGGGINNYIYPSNPHRMIDPFGLKGYWTCVAENTVMGVGIGYGIGAATGGAIGAVGGGLSAGAACSPSGPGALLCAAGGATAGGAAGAAAGAKVGGLGGGIGGAGWGLFTCFSNDDGDCPDKENITKQTATGGASGGWDPDDENRPRQERKPGTSGKEAADNIPKWARDSGERPYVGEKPKEFARRLLDARNGKIDHPTGPRSDFNQLKKWAERAFQNPKNVKGR